MSLVGRPDLGEPEVHGARDAVELDDLLALYVGSVRPEFARK